MKKKKPLFSINKGVPYPFGISTYEGGVNFAIYLYEAQTVSLCFFDENDLKHPLHEIALDPQENKTGKIWHIVVKDLPPHTIYAYKLSHQESSRKKYFLLDPYAKAIASSSVWQENVTKNEYHPRGKVTLPSIFDWEGDVHPNIPKSKLIIYEMHVRSFTKHFSGNVSHPGTFLGIVEKIPYLKELGINAIELMPIHEFHELSNTHVNPETKKSLHNYFGYSTVNFFSVMNRYCSQSHQDLAINEFKTMVKELHKNGIEIILDVVFNHTAEGNEKGPIISFKGMDQKTFYLMSPEGHHLNFSGCGNTINCNDPIVVEFIINVLRYWVVEMHVDGFRFDLASIFTRGENGKVLENPPVVEAMTKDPILTNVKLIAEAWDAGGLYQLGLFAPKGKRWFEWNGSYRDAVRRFIKGSDAQKKAFAAAVAGSFEIYKHSDTPCSSINFITCHDGFSLNDLVSYNEKHNQENGEDNKDGINDNDSWNCGVEGATEDQGILDLRGRQMRNFHLALMVSQGIPMLLMGDEYGHTRHGNNNAWGHDNEKNWFLWNQLEQNSTFFKYYQALIKFRKNEPLLNRETFFGEKEISWHGLNPNQPDWDNDNHFIAFTLNSQNGEPGLYIAFNASHVEQEVTIPSAGDSKSWYWIVNTSNSASEALYEENVASKLESDKVKMASYSSILLKAN